MKKILLPNLFSLLVFLFILSQNNLQAQTTFDLNIEAESEDKTEIAENESEEEDETGIQLSGFVDAYYQYHFNESPFPTSFTETHNSFTPGMANLVISKEGEKVGFVADLAVGPRAEVANGYSGSTLSAIKQLFLTYSPSDAVTFTVGNFGTHVGYEVIDAPANINYSTSYMFSNGPFYHTGVKMDVDLGKGFGGMLGIFNDTDTKIDEVPGKHVGAQLSFSNDNAGIFLNYIGGKDAVVEETDDKVFGHQVDLTATYQVSEAFGLGLNATNKMVTSDAFDNLSWSGAALYANYAFSDGFLLGARGEFIADPDGLIMGATDNSLFSFTLSGNVKVGPVTFIPEFRIDTSSEEVYTDADGAGTTASPALIFAAIYAF